MTAKPLLKKKDRLMSVDPSINNVGMAIWELPNRLLLHQLLHPKPDSREDEYSKSLSIFRQVKEWAKTYAVNRMILEVPEHWAVGGFEARESGGMAKLTVVTGMIYTLFDEMEELKIVRPRDWKGQLPKNVVANRLKDYYLPLGIDLTTLNNNVMDAIAIGHFYIVGSV